MKTMYLDEDEWYPVYSLMEKPNGNPVEVTDEFYLEYKEVYGRFSALQDTLYDMDHADRKIC